jgi:predicted 3-demethylubiquinone-9 3-methyltransferase (glyoxalase superfamily)
VDPACGRSRGRPRTTSSFRIRRGPVEERFEIVDPRVVALGRHSGVIVYSVVAQRAGEAPYAAVISSTFVSEGDRRNLAFRRASQGPLDVRVLSCRRYMAAPIAARLWGRHAAERQADNEGVHMPQRIRPHLWFDTEAEEAAKFYTSIFENSRIVDVAYYPEGAPRPAGSVMTVEFELDGLRIIALNGGPQFTFNEAITLLVECESQEKVDYFWERLSDGGEEGPCGWLRDRYGLGWQVVPTEMPEIFAGADPERSRRAMEAMLGMRKLDVAALRAAADGVAPRTDAA